jgi:uncharacterized protein DUF6894
MCVGRRFSDPKDVMAHATVVATELAEDDDWEPYAIAVIDEHGTEIGRLPVQDGAK